MPKGAMNLAGPQAVKEIFSQLSHPAIARAGRRPVERADQYGVGQRLSRFGYDLQLLVPECCQGPTHRRQRLLPRADCGIRPS